MILNYLKKQTSSDTLALFRFFWGALLAFSFARFVYNGWVSKLYIEPSFHFTYTYFSWVKSPEEFTYLIFAIGFVAAIAVMLGWRYRIAIITLFISFTYIELIDKTTYLNHYYFVSVTTLLLCFLPAANSLSLDSSRKSKSATIPQWTVDTIRIMLAIVYFYAGLAKLNSDWLVEAQPLKLWLRPKSELWLIGPLFSKEWMPYLFAWFGAFYDLTIAFFLSWKLTRGLAYATVIVFHLMTAWLFPIGVFPYVMIVATIIFFDATVHRKIAKVLRNALPFLRNTTQAPPKAAVEHNTIANSTLHSNRWALPVAILLAIQLVLPLRYLAYPGELFWTEEGFRFSWRVMLMEKLGYATFRVEDTSGQFRLTVENTKFLTPLQEKYMSYQPDFILQYAVHLGEHFSQEWAVPYDQLIITTDSYVALNGRPMQRFVQPDVNLLAVDPNALRTTWLTTFKDEITGL